MSTVNLGRVQGGGIFYSTASSGTSIAKSTITPTSIVPLVGDCVVFPNGDLRKITAVGDTNVTCGNVETNFKGDSGEGIDDLLSGVKIVKKAEQDADGNGIGDTYAKKNGTYANMTVGTATNAVNAGKAMQDGSGNNISNTYLKQRDLLNKVYPVGSIYMSMNDVSPASFIGGTWGRIQNRFLYAQGTYGAGATGGEEQHRLTINEMPMHNHNIKVIEAGNAGGGYNHIQYDGWFTDNANMLFSEYVGADQPHNNMPPYYVVYMWRRTA